MKEIKITKEQLDKLLTTSNPFILNDTVIDEGSILICDENNSKFVVSKIEWLGNVPYSLKDIVKIEVEYIDLYNWEKQEQRCYPDDIRFYKLSQLEQILSSKNIDLNLLEHK